MCLCVQIFGIVMKVSDGILGITLLAWGNSIGGIYLHLLHSTMRAVSASMCNMSTCTDAVANMTMARQGFPRMAIGACYGGPLLSILYIHSHIVPMCA